MTIANEQIEALIAEAESAFKAGYDSSSKEQLIKARNTYLGKDAPLRAMQRQLGGLSVDERKATGARIQSALAELGASFARFEAELSANELNQQLLAETIDVTLPVMMHPQGALHPITALINRICDIFVAMGWQVAEGPEVEAEWLNFDALNFTPDHPARFTSDTLFVDPIDDHKIMRTHTSPVQMRTLLAQDLPVYMVAPGKVYRADEYDATHLPVFHQIEGLAVDVGLGMAELKGTLDHLARAMFGEQTEARLRPHYFPFTEPSGEMDIRCFVCQGESVGNPARPCRTCKSEGWIEWGGCGVVNPRVLQAAGIDTDVYSGFAFGMGIDRTVMFRNNASDLRDFVEGDTRFSRQLIGAAR